MRPILVNTKQKVAVLAAGLAVATTGFVAPQGGNDAPSAKLGDSQQQQPAR